MEISIHIQSVNITSKRTASFGSSPFKYNRQMESSISMRKISRIIILQQLRLGLKWGKRGNKSGWS